MSKKISELTAATTPLAGTELLEVVQSGSSKKVSASELTAGGSFRQLLTAARTYYVRTDGSDSNDGLSNTSGGAFLTIQKAIDVASSLDNGGYDITIRAVSGTYTAANSFKSFVGSGRIVIRGDTADMTSTIVSTTSADAFSTTTGFVGDYHLEYMKLQTTTLGNCISVVGGGVVTFQNIAFGACATEHLQSGALSMIKATGNYTINGSAATHIGAYDGGSVRSYSNTITISGTPAFSVAFAAAGRGGTMLVHGNTFSGSATGKCYGVGSNGVIFTNGAATTYLPGNVDGTTETGGQYV